MIEHKEPPNLPSGYILGKKLGQGGYGTVYACKDYTSGKELAVKQLRIDEKKGGIPSLTEANIMSTISHPNIASVVKIGLDNKDLLLFQEKAKYDLHYLVRKKNQLPSPFLLRHWAFAIVQAVACLHQQNIIHCDIKASNILVYDHKDHNGVPNIRLSDFNLANKIWSSSNTFNFRICTSTHRPLEVWLGQKWDMSVDIWSLGCTLFEVAYGETLFPNQDWESIQADRKIIRDRFITCFEEFARKGPGSPQKIPWIYQKDPVSSYLCFKIPSNFYKSEYSEINKLILSMLRFDPQERPTISEIIDHPYFKGLTPVPYEKRAADEQNLSPAKESSYLDYLKKLPNSSLLTPLTISIVKKIQHLKFRYPNFDDDRLRLIGAYWIAHKLILRSSNKDLGYPMSIIYRVERKICEYLSYCLF